MVKIMKMQWGICVAVVTFCSLEVMAQVTTPLPKPTELIEKPQKENDTHAGSSISPTSILTPPSEVITTPRGFYEPTTKYNHFATDSDILWFLLETVVSPFDAEEENNQGCAGILCSGPCLIGTEEITIDGVKHCLPE